MVILNNEYHDIALSEFLVFSDETGAKNPLQIFQSTNTLPMQEKKFRYRGGSVQWLVGTIENRSDRKTWILVQRRAWLSALDIWVLDPEGRLIQHIGPLGATQQAIEKRPKPALGFEIPVEFALDSRSVLLIRIDPIMLRATDGFYLATENLVANHSRWRGFLLPLFLGCLIAIVISHIILVLQVGDGRFAILALAALTSAAASFLFDGGFHGIGFTISNDLFVELVRNLTLWRWTLLFIFFWTYAWPAIRHTWINTIFILTQLLLVGIPFLFPPNSAGFLVMTGCVFASTLLCTGGCWAAFRRGIAGAVTLLAAPMVGLVLYLAIFLPAFADVLGSPGGWIAKNVHIIDYVHRGLLVLLILGLSATLNTRIRALHLERQVAAQENRMRSEFIAMMNHELRTPIASLLGAVELLKKTVSEDARSDLLARIQRAGMILEQLIGDILSLSRAQHQTTKLEDVAFAPYDLLKIVEAVFGQQASEKGINLTVSHTGLPEHILGHESALRQILLNLVANAVKFTDRGAVHLRLIGRRVNDDTLHLTATVTDTGVGMGPETLSRAFEPFFQADRSIGRRHGGSGLGLSICRSLLDAIGGTIQIRSALGRGTTVIVSQPVRPAPPAVVTTPSRRTQRTEARTILLVDDVEENRLIIGQLLAASGHAVTVAPNAIAALECLKTAPHPHIDILVTDIHMPKMSGFALCHEVRRLRDDRISGIPIVALTADTRPDIGQACLDAGFNAVLTKPATITELQSMIADQTVTRSSPCNRPPTQEAGVGLSVQSADHATAASAGQTLLDGPELDARIALLGRDLLIRSATLFLKNVAVYQAELQASWQSADRNRTSAALHRMVSSASAFGLLAVTRHGQHLRHFLDSYGFPAEDQLNRFLLEFTESVHCLRAYLSIDEVSNDSSPMCGPMPQ